MTPCGGAELCLRSATPSGAFRDVTAGIRCEQGWTDDQMPLSLWQLNIVGYERVENVRVRSAASRQGIRGLRARGEC